MDVVDDGEVNELFCTKCNNKFSSKQAYQRHINRKNPCNKKIQCEKCGKTFNRKPDLERHINDRKTPCEPIINNVPPTVSSEEIERKCQFCSRIYASRESLNKHLKRCPVANNKKIFINGTYARGRTVLKEMIKEEIRKEVAEEMEEKMNSELRDLKETLNRQNALLEQLASRPAGNTTNIVVNQANIQINNFFSIAELDQCKSIAQIPHLSPLSITQTLKSKQWEVIPKITELVHGSNAETASKYNNIYLDSEDSDDVMVFGSKARNGKQQWTTAKIHEVFKILLDRGIKLLYAADDDLSAQGKLLTDEEGAKFEMLLNRQKTGEILDEDIEEIRPILLKMKAICAIKKN